MSKWFLTIKLTNKEKGFRLENSIEIKVPQDLRSSGTLSQIPSASVGGVFYSNLKQLVL